mmetsp:Transcript_28623/g.69341  ORF Transcript_28623/g.69341 Transcript_28623/m.69341 type:complete len:271 (+) Transcript_28623:57-869(+)
MTMNPGLRHNRRGKIGDSSQCLEKTRMFDWTAAQSQCGRIVRENHNHGPLHTSHPNVIGPEKNRPGDCNDGNSSFVLTRDALLDKSAIGKSMHNENSKNKDARKARRESGIHRDSLSSTGTAVFRKLPPNPELPVNESFGCLPVPSTMRSRRPLVNRRATPDFDSIAKDEKCTDLSVNLQEIQLCDLTINYSKITRPSRNTFLSSWNPRSKQPTHLPCGSKDAHVLKISMVDLSCGDVQCLEDMKQEARIAAQLHHPNICELQGVIRETK